MPDDAVDSPIWIKLRAWSAERARWQDLAAARGVYLVQNPVRAAGDTLLEYQKLDFGCPRPCGILLATKGYPT